MVPFVGKSGNVNIALTVSIFLVCENPLDTDSIWDPQPKCKDLVYKLLQPVYKRISVEKALEHPWFRPHLVKEIQSKEPLGVNIVKALLNHVCVPTSARTVILGYLAEVVLEKDTGAIGAAFQVLDTNGDGKITPREILKTVGKCVAGETLNELLDEIRKQGGHLTYHGFA